LEVLEKTGHNVGTAGHCGTRERGNVVVAHAVVVIDKQQEVATRVAHRSIASCAKVFVLLPNDLPAALRKLWLQLVEEALCFIVLAAIVHQDDLERRILLPANGCERLLQQLWPLVVRN